MAACRSLQHIFETPLPAENPTLLDSLSSWNQIQPVKPIQNSSFTEIFGELHFNDNSPLSTSSPPASTSCSSFLVDFDSQPKITGECNDNKNEEINQKNSPISKEVSFSSTSPKTNYNSSHKSSDSFSSMNSESLQLCTEGLGFESSGDVEDSRSSDVNEEWQSIQEEKVSFTTKQCYMATSENHFAHRRSRSASVGGFPPPISCISKSGKPWVCFKSYRHDGRFVLKEIRIPTQEFLHAYREGGRLKLHFIHHEDEQVLSEVDREDDVDDDDDDYEEDFDDIDDQDEENGDEHADADAVNEGNEANTGTCSTNEV